MANSTHRIAAVDATRGAAMMFSCLSHFAWWTASAYPSSSKLLANLAMVATPTFLLISGAMVGLLASSPNVERLRWRLTLRGLFLLTAGHALVSLAEAHRDGGFVHTLGSATIIDDIGLATTIAGLALPALKSAVVRVRAAAVSVILFLGIWVVVLKWHPSSAVGLSALRALFGGSADATGGFSYDGPTLQYVAMYTMGLPFGTLLARLYRDPSGTRALERTLLRVALALVVAAAALKLWSYAPFAWAREWQGLTTSITEKYPPSPAYLFFYGASCFLLLALLFRASRTAGVCQSLVAWLSVIGRASLFVFILQYFLYWTLPDLLGIEPGPTAPLVLLANICIAWLFARAWLLIVAWRGRERAAARAAMPAVQRTS